MYYDDTYDNVEEIVSYSIESINRLLKTNQFQLEYSINKVDKNGSYKLVKTCKSLSFLLVIKIKKVRFNYLIKYVMK